MACGSDFTIKCKFQEGSVILRSVNSESTVQELKIHISKETNMTPQSIKILCGYPPRALPVGIDSAKLKDVNIHSGETIIIERESPAKIDEDQQPDPDSSVTVPEASVVPVFERESVARAEGESVARDTSVFEGDSMGRAVEPSFVHVDVSRGDTAPFLRGEVDGDIMLRHVVPSNNSCLFTSFYFCLSNGDFDEKKSSELRSLIAHIVSHDKEKFNEAFLGMGNDKYCEWIQDSQTWGGAIELSILSEHFRVEIVAVDAVNMTMHRFGEGANYANRMILLYDGIHYDPLIVEMDTAVQSIFNANDTRPTEMAMEVAREASSSHQCTDLRNFRLKCMVCRMRLRGHGEARRHAVETGHNYLEEIIY